MALELSPLSKRCSGSVSSAAGVGGPLSPSDDCDGLVCCEDDGGSLIVVQTFALRPRPFVVWVVPAEAYRHFRLVAAGRPPLVALLVLVLVLTMPVLVPIVLLLYVLACDQRRCVWQEETALRIRVSRDRRWRG